MSVASFSLSVANRGSEFTIGGAGMLDVAGMQALRQALEDSCANEGASVTLDLISVTALDPEAVAGLVEAGGFCRERGIPLVMNTGAEFLRVLAEAGYNEELLPL